MFPKENESQHSLVRSFLYPPVPSSFLGPDITLSIPLSNTLNRYFSSSPMIEFQTHIKR